MKYKFSRTLDRYKVRLFVEGYTQTYISGFKKKKFRNHLFQEMILTNDKKRKI